jgi:hypothetical protein
MYVVPDWLLLPVRKSWPIPDFVRLPVPPILPPIVRLCPDPIDAVFEPVSDKALPTLSVNALTLDVAVVVIVALESANVEPLSVKLAFLPAVPLLPKVSELTVIDPMWFVVVVCAVPPKTRLHVPEVVGNVLQFELVDQLALPPPPDQVVVPAQASSDPSANATARMAATETRSDIFNDANFMCERLLASSLLIVRLLLCTNMGRRFLSGRSSSVWAVWRDSQDSAASLEP